jgi:hypothetical protein
MDVPDALLARLRKAVESGDTERLAFDFWDRGGPPGQGFESDLLSLRPEGEALTRTRFDRKYEPPFRVEERTGSASPEARMRFATLAERAFDKTFPEEEPVRKGGVTKLSIKVYLSPPAGQPPAEPGLEMEKTFFERLPDELGDLGQLVRERMDALLRHEAAIVSKPAPT